jgi:hypothetical protein
LEGNCLSALALSVLLLVRDDVNAMRTFTTMSLSTSAPFRH